MSRLEVSFSLALRTRIAIEITPRFGEDQKFQNVSKGHWGLIMSEQEKFIKPGIGRRPVLFPGVPKKGIGNSKELRYTSLGHRRGRQGNDGT
jgi:hypothetical protein